METSEPDDVFLAASASEDDVEATGDAAVDPAVHQNSAPNVPEKQKQAYAPDVESRINEVLSSFKGEIQPTNISPGYRVAIILTAAVMVMLPLAYVGLIGGVIFGVYSMLGVDTSTSRVPMMERFLPHFLALGISVLVSSPLLALLLKPLLAKPVTSLEPRTLLPEHEPVLFAFVQRICEAVQAPVPCAIQVAIDANASASYRRGIFSMFGNELVLTIGLPLVASMNVQQLGGVIAHEFGHFTQGTGMRLTYLTRTIDHWFMRAVYQRDRIDRFLVQASSVPLVYVWVFFNFLRLMVLLIRGILWLLMMVGKLLTGYLLRHMEFDADRYETRLVGTETFTTTQWQLNLLQVSQAAAIEDVNDFDREARLPDNLPRLIEHNISQIPDTVRDEIRKALYEEKTDLLSTHPCDGERLANAASENAPGVLHNNAPARHLFTRFESLAKLVTTEFYREVLQSKFDPGRIHDTGKLIAAQTREFENFKGLQQFCLNQFTGFCGVLLPYWNLGRKIQSSPAKAFETLRAQSVELAIEYSGFYEQFKNSRNRYIELQQRSSLVRAGLHASFIKKSSEWHNQLQNDASGEMGSAKAMWKTLDPFRRTLGRRLMVDLELLRSPKMLERLGKDSSIVGKVNMLLSVAKVIQQHHSSFETLTTNVCMLAVLLENQTQDIDEVEYREFIAAMRQIDQMLRNIWTAFKETAYPFKHGDGTVSMSRFLLQQFPDPQNPGEMCMAAADVLERVQRLNARIFSRLTELAEEVERTFGLEPLVEYVEKPLDDEDDY